MAVSKKGNSKRQPFVSIVIPVLNAGRTLHETFVHLFGGVDHQAVKIKGIQYPHPKFEVLVADGGSVDSTLQIVKSWQKKARNLKLLQIKDCQSLGQARNAALKAARGEFILFTDGDCVPSSDWVTQLIKPMLEDPAVGWVGGEIRALRMDPANRMESYCEQTGFMSVEHRMGIVSGGVYEPVRFGYPREVNGSQTTPYFSTANAAAPRRTLQAVGNQVSLDGGAESVDLSLRISGRGYKLYFQPAATVRRMSPSDLSRYCQQVASEASERPLAIKTHSKKFLEIRFQFFGDFSLPPIPFPVQGMVYWGDFHMIHLFGVLALVKSLMVRYLPNLSPNPFIPYQHMYGLWLLFGFFVMRYFAPCLSIRPTGDFLYWCWVRYRSNLAMVWGGLKGSLKSGRPYIEQSW